jgi:hypothetical protein
MEYTLKRSKKCAVAERWCSAPSSSGTNPVYYVLGQTAAGRYLFCVVIQFPDGKGFPVTARPMTQKEQRRFNQWKNQ